MFVGAKCLESEWHLVRNRCTPVPCTDAWRLVLFWPWLANDVCWHLRRETTTGSKSQGKIGIKVAGLGRENEHQVVEPGSREICMWRRRGEGLSFVLAD